MNRSTEASLDEYRKMLMRWLEEREKMGGTHHAPEPDGSFVDNGWLVGQVKKQVWVEFEKSQDKLKTKPF